MKEINFKLVVLVLGITLGAFFLGNFLINSYQINRALQTDLTAINGVTEVTIDELESGYKLQIELTQVDDLQDTFLQIKQRIEESLTEKEYEVTFTSSGDSDLDRLSARTNLALYEAIETGEFVALEDRMTDYKNKYDLDEVKVQIDKNHIYLRLTKNDQEIYQVIDRG
ncbi:hypothetical protein [Halanaerobaculum tunisiense]